jgi:hypothetical protein
MSMAETHSDDYRHAQIKELGLRTRLALKSAIPILALLLGGIAAYQLFTGRPGGVAEGLIAVGACIALATWRKAGSGLPLMPMIVLQHVLVYGLPLLVMQETISSYPVEFFTKAGVELLVFFLSLAAAWRMGIYLFPLARPICYGLHEFQKGGAEKLNRIGFGLIVFTFVYQVLDHTGILGMFLNMLPYGVFPIVWAVVSAAGSCGFFIVSLLLGGGRVSATGTVFFWVLLAANCMISASSFLLSSALIMVITVVIGLFWSRGRVPWFYVTIVLLLFSFLNIGKVVMRHRYWGEAGADQLPEFTLDEIPDHYVEWFGVSYDCVMGNDVKDYDEPAVSEDKPEEKQSLLERVNNMQNLLFVIDAMETHHIEPLHGETYTIIPKLLIPRFLWPDKPGTHEGQVLLNVHFGRQDLISTKSTFVAWGLLPEAYGNFGPIAGSLFLGTVLGLLCSWMEQYTANKLVISVEGFVTFTIFLGMANSFELVASVLVTAIEQSIIPIVMAAAPFARRIVVAPPIPPPEE